MMRNSVKFFNALLLITLLSAVAFNFQSCEAEQEEAPFFTTVLCSIVPESVEFGGIGGDAFGLATAIVTDTLTGLPMPFVSVTVITTFDNQDIAYFEDPITGQIIQGPNGPLDRFITQTDDNGTVQIIFHCDATNLLGPTSLECDLNFDVGTSFCAESLEVEVTP